mgnify:CR=1 FL=1|tara:strand:- start:7611 stop:7862 length:252 start_codon:yes stop_codon:yes gene_type:complete
MGDLRTFKDSETGKKQKIHIDYYAMGMTVDFKGYGVQSHKNGGGTVLIELRDGVPHLIIWGDINSQDPTEVISLAGASESLRK